MKGRVSLYYRSFVVGIILTETTAFQSQPPGHFRRLTSPQLQNKPDRPDSPEPSCNSEISRGGFLKALVATTALVTSVTAAPSHAKTTDTAAWISTTDPYWAETTASSNWLAAATAADSSSTLEESISGFLAGAALATTKTLVKYPLDTATVRLQMPGTPYSVARVGELMDGCYRGVTTPLVSNIPAGAVFFAVKDATKSSLKASVPSLSKWQRTCWAVAAAQIPYWWVRNPSEVIKTRQQANIPGYANVTAIQAFQQVSADAAVANNATAVSAYYTGFWENILYAYPADVIKFLVYDQFTGTAERLSPARGAVAGACSTAVAQFVTTPLDVVRNRVMAETKKTDDTSVNGHPTSRPSYVAALVEIGRREGISGLLAGATPRVGKALLSGAIQFATYEETKQELANLFAGRRI